MQDTPEILGLILPYLPEDLKSLAKSCENILHLTHSHSFFSLFTNHTHADGMKVDSIFLSMNVTIFNILLIIMIKITIIKTTI